jgi:putative hydrolase of the HAD superfamily
MELILRFNSMCSYVHGRLPYDRIAADPRLPALLQSIPQRKIVCTFFSQTLNLDQS